MTPTLSQPVPPVQPQRCLHQIYAAERPRDTLVRTVLHMILSPLRLVWDIRKGAMDGLQFEQQARQDPHISAFLREVAEDAAQDIAVEEPQRFVTVTGVDLLVRER